MGKANAVILFCVLTLSAAAASPRFFDQNWSEEDRQWFYTTPQGSKLIPYAWALALERNDGTLWTENLERFGFLTNPKSGANPDGLPVGVVRDDLHLGLTCAACHTSALEFRGTTYRIDGGPSDAALWDFLVDLGESVSVTAKSAASPRFDRFAKRVLGGDDSPDARAALFKKLRSYDTYYSSFIRASKPTVAWGRARIDAFGMIFNRVTSIDLKVPQNSCKANAPVSVPMVWDSSWQSVVQWTGGLPSQHVDQRLARNIGEVLGVFAEIDIDPAKLKYPSTAKKLNLLALEDEIADLRSPKWQPELGAIDESKRARGQTLYREQCLMCHAIVTPGVDQNVQVKAVGTDPQTATVGELRVGNPGPLADVWLIPFKLKFGDMKAGSNPPGIGCNPLSGNTAPSGKITFKVVLGALLYAKTTDVSPVTVNTDADVDDKERDSLRRLLSQNTDAAAAELEILAKALAARKEDNDAMTTPFAYKARPLNGVWATAPFLHNGSVPTLWDLLLPPSQRPATFYVGNRELDPVKVGFVSSEGPNTTRFDTRIRGNRNIGHEFGIDLSEDDRMALIEYLKTL